MSLICIWTISRYLSYMEKIWEESNKENHCCMISRYGPYMEINMEKRWNKLIIKLLYHFQILAIYGENMEGKCNIIIFVTSFQTCIWYKSEPVLYSTHSPHVINNAIDLSGRNVIMISPSISPNSLKYMRTHSFFHHTFIQSWIKIMPESYSP